MKKLLFILFLGLTALTAVQAQTARQVLDKTAAKLKKDGGIKAAFQVTAFDGTTQTGSGSGTIYIKGNRFRIASPQMQTWFDGTTQWSYLEGSNEVNVSTPTDAELQGMNPYTFVNLYKKGYRATMKETTLRGKACYEVNLVATGNNGIRQMILSIDKGSYVPLCVRLRQGDKRWTRISVRDYAGGNKWSDSFFRFDRKDLPRAEIIDLR